MLVSATGIILTGLCNSDLSHHQVTQSCGEQHSLLQNRVL